MSIIGTTSQLGWKEEKLRTALELDSRQKSLERLEMVQCDLI